MSKFKFGLVWTLFVTPIFVLCLVVPGEQRGGEDMSPMLFIFFVLFEFIGLYMLISGLKTVIKDKKTKKYGTVCYGIVRSIMPTGSSSNDRQEFKALVQFVNPENYQLETLEEIVGFEPYKYPVDSYLLCKYYQGDINIESIVPGTELPGDVLKQLTPISQTTNTMNADASGSPDVVTIDGVQYKRES